MCIRSFKNVDDNSSLVDVAGYLTLLVQLHQTLVVPHPHVTPECSHRFSNASLDSIFLTKVVPFG